MTSADDELQEGVLSECQAVTPERERRRQHRQGLSRSTFFERFLRTVGVPPMEYMVAWRMAVAKDLLRRQDLAIGEVAERVGYGAASTFSAAFSRHVGQSPSRYAASARTSLRS